MRERKCCVAPDYDSGWPPWPSSPMNDQDPLAGVEPATSGSKRLMLCRRSAIELQRTLIYLDLTQRFFRGPARGPVRPFPGSRFV